MELPGSPVKLHILPATISKKRQQDLVFLVDFKIELWLKLWRSSLVARQVLMEICPCVVHGFPSEAHVKDGFRHRHIDTKKTSFKMKTLPRLLWLWEYRQNIQHTPAVQRAQTMKQDPSSHSLHAQPTWGYNLVALMESVLPKAIPSPHSFRPLPPALGEHCSGMCLISY